ncbi:MAG: pyridoxal phosphate-dependent aminotransferase [Candidatus Pacebacteria bacterium]|nr:pyridoxal phosphate-dependent aminotransferase [Saprospiraceae bacterium]MBP9819033.1 pyridoxal phosphate-dependent aminotransferase [Candidatus Paceibacterota bacterium]
MYNDKKRIIKDNSLPDSIRSMVRIYPSNQVNRLAYGGLPHLGNALWDTWSSLDIQKASEAYENYSLSTNLLIKGCKPPKLSKVRLGGGSPARLKPFGNSILGIKNALENKILSDYPLASGDESHKLPIIKYFRDTYSKKIKVDNIIFTHSSTQGFTLIMEAILDYGDVILMTSPNYGLFSFIPERVGGKVSLLELKEIDNWKINPADLKRSILNINKELRVNYDTNRSKYVFRRSDHPPKVVAFVNLNPHNPLGTVYGRKERKLLETISNICDESGVFVIDDLAYAGLEFNQDNKALPVCTLHKQFNNTITLYTLSKSYGLAGLRSGMIIANEIVTSVIRDRIFQSFDSLSVLQSAAMSSSFTPDNQSYFSNITKEYFLRYLFIKAMVEGVRSLSDSEKNSLYNFIRKENIAVKVDGIFEGIADTHIILPPKSGFFLLLDLTKLKGKVYKGLSIVDDKSLLQFLYTSGNIKALTGGAFYWPEKDHLVIRVTTALEYKDLITSFMRLKASIQRLV